MNQRARAALYPQVNLRQRNLSKLDFESIVGEPKTVDRVRLGVIPFRVEVNQHRFVRAGTLCDLSGFVELQMRGDGFIAPKRAFDDEQRCSLRFGRQLFVETRIGGVNDDAPALVGQA